MTAMINVTSLSKEFRTSVRRPGAAGALRSLVNPERITKTAVRDVSFIVDSGELLALLGPNGAGKSTIIKILSGLLVPTSGDVTVNNLVPHRNRERYARTIGAVFGHRTQLWWDLPARESFSILRDIYGIPEEQYRARLREFDNLLDMSSFWHTRVRHLSLGQRVRCDLAAALLHDPVVLFLDEPTIGMDIVVKEQVRTFLRDQVERRRRTVVLTTHDMTEVGRLAERVVLVNHGRVVLDGPLDTIRQRFGGTWQVEVTLDRSALKSSEIVPPPGLRVVLWEGPRVVFAPAGDCSLTAHEALKCIVERYQVAGIALREPDLEDVMRAAYLEDHADGERKSFLTAKAN